jgi:hypothetical protein
MEPDVIATVTHTMTRYQEILVTILLTAVVVVIIGLCIYGGIEAWKMIRKAAKKK